MYVPKVFFKSSCTRGHITQNSGFLHSFSFGSFANERDNNVGYCSLEFFFNNWKGNSNKNEEENEHQRENWLLYAKSESVRKLYFRYT